MFTIGQKVLIEGEAVAEVIKPGETPVDTIVVMSESGEKWTVDPQTTAIEVVKDVENTNNTKEEVNVNIQSAVVSRTQIPVAPKTTTAVSSVEDVKRIAASRMLPEVTPEDLLIESDTYQQKLPSGAIVNVRFRKVASRVGKLIVEDELGSRIFTVMASKQDPNDIYIPIRETKSYESNGEKKEAVILETDNRANAFLKAIARNIMRASGIVFEPENMLPSLGDEIPF